MPISGRKQLEHLRMLSDICLNEGIYLCILRCMLGLLGVAGPWTVAGCSEAVAILLHAAASTAVFHHWVQSFQGS